jgi:integrase
MDRDLSAAVAFGNYTPGAIAWDEVVRGLFVRFGAHRISWGYHRQTRTHGKRRTIAKVLGTYPLMTVDAARKAALIESGKIAAGKAAPGKREALKVSDAFARYVEYLETRKAGSAWPDKVRSIGRVHLLPEFGGMPLQELAALPAVVADWHKAISKSAPVTANRAAKVLNALYRRAARLDRTLPPVNLTSGVTYNTETRSQSALALRDFPKWMVAWRKIESPTRQAFHMLNLLCGCRPGELVRLRWSDVLPRERVFVIRSPKVGDDIRVPMSRPIAAALKLAHGKPRPADGWVFPGRGGAHLTRMRADGLPAWGMQLRRTFRTLAADLETDEILVHVMMGHKMAGVSAGYIQKAMLSSGAGMRKAQRRISCEALRRLGVSRF